MTEQDKYKESIDEQPVAPVKETSPTITPTPEIPQPKVEVEVKVEPEPAKEVVPEPLPSASGPAPAPAVSSDDDQKPVQPAGDSANQRQIERLSQIAFTKGLDAAIEEAKKIDNPYILDEFHDALTNELYSKLIEAGKLEQK